MTGAMAAPAATMRTAGTTLAASGAVLGFVPANGVDEGSTGGMRWSLGRWAWTRS
jgi:hypothetical protein